MTPEPESVADRLAAQLANDGELVDHGGFDIDAGKALDKLAKFQLADPRAYILRWAEAGLTAGATRLRFDLDRDLVCVAFDRDDAPVFIPGAVLERLTSVLVGAGPAAEAGVPRELLVHLAIGVVVGLGLRPHYLAIESVAADRRGARVVYGDEVELEALVDAEPGTRIYLRESFDLGQRLDGVAGQRPEHALLREHCRFASTPIYLDNRRIEREEVLGEALCSAPVVLDGVEVGVAGFDRVGAPARVHLLANGFLVETLTLPDGHPGFIAAIDTPLPRDLSRANIARSPELDAALVPVYEVHHRLLGTNALVKRVVQPPTTFFAGGESGPGTGLVVSAVVFAVIIGVLALLF